MNLKLYNTLSRKKEVFKPLNPPRVGMYTCGPTVYGPGHLGHGRSYTNFDLLKRVFLSNDYKVKHVLNITDVHDDMIKRANELGVTIFELAEKYTPLFLKDLKDLNIIPADVYPKVTEHIPEIIQMTQLLLDKGFAYVEKDGSVYFRVAKFPDYGKLSGIRIDQTKTGTRVETDKYKKEDIADFALWKGHKPGEPFWDSLWGKGRPGWHIECSVMAKKHLGDTIDLHAGAIDLKFPHHENEIAQSEAANGVKFANFWFHGGLLEVEGQKMSKSLGNYIEMHEVKKRGFDPLALRYLFLSAHYRSKMNFTWESLKGAQNSLEGLYEKTRELKSSVPTFRRPSEKGYGGEAKNYPKKFLGFINDDLNLPKALALMWQLVKDEKVSAQEKYNLLLDFDRVFGLGLEKVKEIKIPQKIKELVQLREKYRKAGDFKKADQTRKEVEKLGFKIEDTTTGPKIKRK